MRRFVLVLLLCSAGLIRAQIFWTETFGNGCTQGTAANGLVTTNGTWTQTNFINDPESNEWYVSSCEAGMGLNNCGDGCLSNPALLNRTLHIGANDGWTPTDPGAAYNAGGFCGVLFCVAADKRVESPVINCTGYTNIQLNFLYLEGGQASTDNMTVWYYDGVSWSQLTDPGKTLTNCVGGQGRWAAVPVINLPVSANNNPNVKIGFRWTNNDDGVGTDPSTAIDDITLSVVSGSPPVAAFTTSNNTICAGSCINFTDNSTNTPTAWSWLFPGGTPASSNSQNPNNVCYNTAGSYTVTLTATNANGSNSTTQVITVNPIPTITVSPSNPTYCTGGNASLTASGATSYNWSPATGLSCTTCANPTTNVTTTTTYTVTGTGPGNCTSTTTVTVTVTPSLVGTASANPSSICFGDSTLLSGGGGTNYSWTPTASVSCGTCQNTYATPTTTTTYTVAVSGGTCPTVTATVTVTVNPLPTVSVSPPAPAFCQGGNAPLTASGANAWLWSPATGLSCTTCANPLANPTATTTYTVIGTGAGNCTSSATVTVTVNPLPTVSVTPPSATICAGNNIGLTVTGGQTYAWAPGTGLSCTTCANPTASPTASTTYTVTVTDANGCTNTAAVPITVNPCAPPVAAITASATAVCMPGCITFSDNSTNSPTSWSWTFQGGTPATSTQQNPGQVCWTAAGTYLVTLIVSNANGTDTTSQSITVNPMPTATTGPDVTIPIGGSTVLPVGGGTSYTWSPATGLSCTACPNPTASPTVTTTYCVTVTDANGCTDDSCMTVFVDQNCPEVFLPTGFSPDGDGKNDEFYPIIPCFESMWLAVYDRWGEKIFESDDPGKKWDGTFRGAPLDAAVFVYYFHYRQLNGKDEKLKGNVTLVR
ncbi:MAG: gliding motility-associated C-terminal domain-containing protein [Bacteroidia bacterium]|nr:gliding motility-associated C-terminal domain-containing protein [Bacteroidia bacterium]